MRSAGVLIAFAALLSACFERKIYEDTPVLRTDTAILDVESEDAQGGLLTKTITVISNRSWNGSLSFEGEEEWVSLGMEEYANPSCSTMETALTLNFLDNYLEQPRNATLNLVCAGGQTATVHIIQSAPAPRITIDRERTATSLSPDEERLTVYFGTNGDWTASLEDSSEGISLSAESGSRTDTSLELVFGTNCAQEPGAKKSATLVLSRGDATDRITVTQQYWWPLLVVFHNGTSLMNEENWPFSSPKRSDLGTGSSSATFKGELTSFTLKFYVPLVFKLKATNGVWRNSAQGFVFNGEAGDYFEFCAPEGKTLRKLAYVTGHAAINLSVTDADGTVLEGGEAPADTYAPGAIYTWLLGGTQAGQPYRLTITKKGGVFVREVRLYFEMQ